MAGTNQQMGFSQPGEKGGYPPPPQQQAYPPPYTQAPTAAGPPPLGAQGQTAVVVGPTAVVVNQQFGFGKEPVQMSCPNCHTDVLTSVKSAPSTEAWLIGTLLAVFGCWCGCCLIPCFVESMQIYTHSCPSCRYVIGRNRLR